VSESVSEARLKRGGVHAAFDPTVQIKMPLVQWSFRKTGTLETLARQVEIGVWVQAPGTNPRGSGGITPTIFF